MGIKTPASLLDCSMKPLVSLTLTSLQNVGPKYSVRRTTSITEILPPTAPTKRKFINETSTQTAKEQVSKRMRRRSVDDLHSVPLKNHDYEETISKDDCFVNGCSIVDVVIILRKYFSCLPQNLWNTFFHLAIRELNNLEDPNGGLSATEIRAIELLFCKKVSFFSTRMMSHYVYVKCESLIFERLRLCRNLKGLEIRFNVQEHSKSLFLISLARFNHISSITLLPESKFSWHEAIPVLSKHCKLLEELTITYDSEFISSRESNISCLKNCTKLRKLILHSFGKGAEAQFIVALLLNLKGLEHFFHRELPQAIVDIYLKCTKEGYKHVLNLKALSLVMYCKAVGSQLCYLPDDSLVQIASICPFLRHLNLVMPFNLSDIAKAVPSLVSLSIHDCDLKESLTHCKPNGELRNLLSLSLKNTSYVDFGSILLISECCHQLHELEIRHCNLFWSNDLNNVKSASFPNLKKLTILKIPDTERMEPEFVIPYKLYVDKTLLKFLILNSKKLQSIFLEFDIPAVTNRDRDGVPTAVELTSYIAGCKELKEMMLLSYPYITFNMINSIVESCPNIKHFWNINFSEIPLEDVDKILRKFSYLFSQFCERKVNNLIM